MALSLVLTNECQQVPMRADNTARVITLATLMAPSSSNTSPTSPLSQSQPLDLVLAIDRSDSMFEAGRLKLVQRVVSALYATLNPGDRLGLLTFGTFAKVQVPLSAPSNAHITKIATLVVDESQELTNLSEAITSSYALFSFPKESEKAIILLTDGDATAGAIELAELRALVDGDSAISLHTFGFGSDHSASVLSALATKGHGQYAYIKDEESMLQAFAATMGMLRSIVARNVKLELTASTGILKHVRTPFPVHRMNDQRCTVHFPNMSSGERRDVLIQVDFRFLDTPPSSDVTFMPVEVHVSYDGKKEQHYLATRVSFLPPDPSSIVVTNAEVRRQWLRMKVVKVMKTALTHDAPIPLLENAIAIVEREDQAGSADLLVLLRDQMSQMQTSGGESHQLESAVSSLSQQRAAGSFGMRTEAQAQSYEAMSQYLELEEVVEREPPKKKQRVGEEEVEESQMY